MEENKHSKELDAFTKKYVKEIPQEKLTIDFTSSIMKSIVVESTKSVFKTTPLISQKGWFIIVLGIVASFLISIKESNKDLLNLPKVDFSFFDKVQLPNVFESLVISNTLLYAVCFFGMMFFVQIIFLKSHFNKQLE
jgi:hypothetical protein